MHVYSEEPIYMLAFTSVTTEDLPPLNDYNRSRVSIITMQKLFCVPSL